MQQLRRNARVLLHIFSVFYYDLKSSMPVYSMTGYASAQSQPSATSDFLDVSAAASGANSTGAHITPATRIGLEVRTVNSRFLDISFRLPDELRQHEPALRELVQSHCKRGKLELRVSLESATNTALTEPSARLLQRLVMLQNKVQTWLPDASALSVSDIMRLSANESGDTVDWGPNLLALATRVLLDLQEARAREGSRLASMLREHVASLRALSKQALPLVPQLMEQQRLRFLDRWREALALADASALPDTARDRALTEAAAFAIRIDVAEELTRIASHLDELDRLLKKGGELGKRLDFLIQELHREANTLGSKSAVLEMTRISVDMKVLIEQMREQVQNIE
jgi:uncharacterized protein (TIGR00255 family)